jgi:Holliday junction resolvasome RuvABC endonuclease subunit
MKIMGLDVSTQSTGWSVLKLIDNNISVVAYGLIRGEKTMSTIQRLHLLGNELKKTIELHNPDEIGIEEIAFMRGPKILKVLSRFSGVAIFQVYSYKKKEPFFFEPPAWKKNLGISGSSLKAEVQVEICSRFNFLRQEQIIKYKEDFNRIKADTISIKLDGKKQGINKKDLSKKLKEFDKQYEKISTDIYSDCGVNNDIADSIGIALATINEIKSSKN